MCDKLSVAMLRPCDYDPIHMQAVVPSGRMKKLESWRADCSARRFSVPCSFPDLASVSLASAA